MCAALTLGNHIIFDFTNGKLSKQGSMSNVNYRNFPYTTTPVQLQGINKLNRTEESSVTGPTHSKPTKALMNL